MTAMFSPAEVVAATDAHWISRGEVMEFANVSTDTRKIKAGDLFLALYGEHFDGHNFVPEAIRRGASGVIISRSLDFAAGQVHIFQVADTLQALQGLARFHRSRFQVPVIAVTGSNGKTSTKDMIAAVLGEAMSVLKTEANFNNEIGLSQTLLRLQSDHKAVVVEMGMRGMGEIAGLAAVALPTVGVVTNVGETHVERLGSIENIASAKSELIEALNDNGVAILNGDDIHVCGMRRKTAARAVTFGLQPEVDVRALQVEYVGGGVKFRCKAGERVFDVVLPIPGIHNVYNALAAIAVGLELGVTPETIARGLALYEPGKMRLNIRAYGDIMVIDDTYNASPLSMAAAIDVLSTVAKGRKIAAIGDMLELGSSGPAAHRKVGEQLAAIGTAAVVTVGDLAALAGETAMANGVSAVITCRDHATAQRELEKILQPGDTLLLKGSRGMAMEKLLTVFPQAAGN